MKIDIEITGTLDSDHLIEYILEVLNETGVSDIQYREHQYYGDWLAGLPKDSLPRLNSLCLILQ